MAMTPTTNLLEMAAALAPADRVRLVSDILATLDEPDAVVDAAWQVEVDRRLDAIDRGERSSEDWSEARRKLGL